MVENNMKNSQALNTNALERIFQSVVQLTGLILLTLMQIILKVNTTA
jgi:hypothetical protein